VSLPAGGSFGGEFLTDYAASGNYLPICRMGDCCELFYEDAEKVARGPDIALTSRQPRYRFAEGYYW
jgi:DNA mismatch repair ATPase MutS